MLRCLPRSRKSWSWRRRKLNWKPRRLQERLGRPGKGGQTFEGPGGEAVPIFNSMDEAVAETGANTSVVYVPPAFAANAILEAADSGVSFVVAITEGVPVLDMARAHAFARDRGVRILGPNCPGLISPGMKLGLWRV